MEWNQLVKTLGPKLFRFFAFRVPEHHASDLVQETLIRLLQNVRNQKFQPERSKIQTYAFGIAVIVQKEDMRKNKKFIYCELNGDEQSYYHERDILAIRTLKESIKTLSVNEQAIMQLLLEQELTIDEISHITNIAKNTVKSHIHRSKIKIKKILNEKGSPNA